MGAGAHYSSEALWKIGDFGSSHERHKVDTQPFLSLLGNFLCELVWSRTDSLCLLVKNQWQFEPQITSLVMDLLVASR